MAKSIEETPVLKGQDAQAFWDSMKNPKHSPTKEIELEKSRRIYKLFSKK